MSQNFEYKDVGVILEVTPHINNAGDVELKIHAESSVVVPGVQILRWRRVRHPQLPHRPHRQERADPRPGWHHPEADLRDPGKTPILGDIPGLKWLFNKKDTRNKDVELMVFLRPKVTRTPKDAEELMNEIYEKAPNVKKWKDDLHPKKDPKPAKNPPGK